MMVKNNSLWEEIRKLKKDYKKSKDRLLKEFPNIIDRYALHDDKIEEQERLFRRNSQNKGDSKY